MKLLGKNCAKNSISHTHTHTHTHTHAHTHSHRRSIIWLQKRRDDIMERLRGSTHSRNEDHHELMIGRLRQDRVRIPREGKVGVVVCCHGNYSFVQMLPWAYAALSAHSERKSILEVRFIKFPRKIFIIGYFYGGFRLSLLRRRGLV